MTMTIDPEIEKLARQLEQFDVPDSLRAEIIGGRIVMSPIGRSGHAKTIDIVGNQLRANLPDGLWVTGAVQFRCPRTGEQPIPDLSVVPEAAMDEDEVYLPIDVAELVVEVGSASTVHEDRENKRLLYAAANIPFYLLVDRLSSEVTLFSDPDDGEYRSRCTVPFGKKLTIPEPFAMTLETDRFPKYVER